MTEDEQPVVSVENSKPKRRQAWSGTSLIFAFAFVALGAFVMGTRSNQIYAAVAPFFGIKASADTLDLQIVQTTYQQLKANYDGKLDTQALINGAARGLVAAAGDQYTVFMDKTEANAFNKDLTGQVTGVGIEIGTRGGQPTVLRVVDNSPAKQAGLKSGDVLVAVNGDSVNGAATDTVATKIRGDAGTTVKLTFSRGGVVQDVNITRAQVSDPSVRSEVRAGIGILTITRFDDQTGSLARAAAQSFVSQHVHGVILDLRDDGGGYLDAAQQVASLWLKDQLVVTEKTDGIVTDNIQSDSNPPLAGIKTVVLVNGSSASASEIVSGALQDHHAATLIGEKTFGKGTVQKVIGLPGGAILKVTVARWYTPNGKNITKEGITPNKTVGLTQADANAGRDPQMATAVSAIGQ